MDQIWGNIKDNMVGKREKWIISNL